MAFLYVVLHNPTRNATLMKRAVCLHFADDDGAIEPFLIVVFLILAACTDSKDCSDRGSVFSITAPGWRVSLLSSENLSMGISQFQNGVLQLERLKNC